MVPALAPGAKRRATVQVAPGPSDIPGAHVPPRAALRPYAASDGSSVNGSSEFDAVVDGFGGIVRLDEIGQRFESEWPAGVVTGQGIVRLLVRVQERMPGSRVAERAERPGRSATPSR